MDDLRIAWMRERILTGLEIEKSVFNDLLLRDEHKVEKELLELLNNPNSVNSSAMIFYSLVSEVEREVEIEEGQNFPCIHTCTCSWGHTYVHIWSYINACIYSIHICMHIHTDQLRVEQLVKEAEEGMKEGGDVTSNIGDDDGSSGSEKSEQNG